MLIAATDREVGSLHCRAIRPSEETMDFKRVSGGILAFASLVAGAALADAGAINACANRSTGSLRLASTCLPHEEAISWNRSGPPGPPGPQGATGAPGAPGGGVGISVQFAESPGGISLSNVTSTTVAQVTLPAGAWFVSTLLNVQNDSSSPNQLGCQQNGNAAVQSYRYLAPWAIDVIDLEQVVISDGATPVLLKCFLDGDKPAHVFGGEMNAMLAGQFQTSVQ
jgi:hypothetical protein